MTTKADEELALFYTSLLASPGHSSNPKGAPNGSATTAINAPGPIRRHGWPHSNLPGPTTFALIRDAVWTRTKFFQPIRIGANAVCGLVGTLSTGKFSGKKEIASEPFIGGVRKLVTEQVP